MANRELSPKGGSAISRLDLIKSFVLRSAAIGLIAGAGLGVLFGSTFLFFIWTGIVGAGLGFGLGLVNGLLTSTVTCLFFYPLRNRYRYRVVVTVVSALAAWGGVIVFGPWYFSDTAMTPVSAVLIGFSSVLASAIAGWAGGLTGQQLAHWYGSRSVAHRPDSIDSQPANDARLDKLRYWLYGCFSAQKWGWATVALFALLSPRLGNSILKVLVCGDLNPNVVSCLPSPRLYTSIAAGLRVSLPVFVCATLVVVLVQGRHRFRGSR
ncbi:hypothetical protein IQ273_21650 [Nodosilinea sp. LEGE 07298]|uniref:hypothetical protein n=1 Tax=Nodosilinea sp. LEGE 07298 TaxID=2777970 RepID=UPI0019E4F2DD|nr:hypothetical protein [Nodosilinea sp. LEGE 07298]MBE9112014.1 hypothetical protein [Nodosilinea sp. LEGE 07298]